MSISMFLKSQTAFLLALDPLIIVIIIIIIIIIMIIILLLLLLLLNVRRNVDSEKSESQMGFESTTLRDLVGCSNH